MSIATAMPGALMAAAAAVLAVLGLARTDNLPSAFCQIPTLASSNLISAAKTPLAEARTWRAHAKLECEDHKREMRCYALDKAEALDAKKDDRDDVTALRKEARDR
jgi:hypothetical protein